MRSLIREIKKQGIDISIFGENLKLKLVAPDKKITDEIVKTVRAHKSEIISELKSKPVCYCCGGQSFWRKKKTIPGRWICGHCHKPGIGEKAVEWLQ